MRPSATPGPVPASVSARPAAAAASDAAQAPGSVEPRGQQVARAQHGEGAGEVGGFLRVEPRRQHSDDVGAARPGQREQRRGLRRIEGVAARGVDQHGLPLATPRHRRRERRRVGRGDQRRVEHAGEGGELLGRAGALVIGGDHQGRGAAAGAEHGAGRELGAGQALAGAERAGQQQRPLHGVGQRGGTPGAAPALADERAAFEPRGELRRNAVAGENAGGGGGALAGAKAATADGTEAGSAASSAAVTSTPLDVRRLPRITASAPSSARTIAMASAMRGAVKTRMRMRDQTLPTVRMRARGWISACASTVVAGRNRSTMARTCPRMPPEQTSAGDSPGIRRRVEARRAPAA